MDFLPLLLFCFVFCIFTIMGYIVLCLWQTRSDFTRCGSNSGQCVRVTDVCDNIVDCVNEWDESSAICDFSSSNDIDSGNISIFLYLIVQLASTYVFRQQQTFLTASNRLVRRVLTSFRKADILWRSTKICCAQCQQMPRVCLPYEPFTKMTMTMDFYCEFKKIQSLHYFTGYILST